MIRQLKNQGLPALHFGESSPKIMWAVSFATLAPLFFISLKEPRRLAITFLAIISALFLEALINALRKRNPFLTLKDGSAVLTAILLSLSLPITASIFLIFWGIFFAIVIAKGIYGGLGNNIFNPAMFAFVALLISFPAQMSFYSPDYLGLFSIFDFSLDATSSPTILDKVRQSRIAEKVIINPNFSLRQFLLLLLYFFTALYLIKKNYIDGKISFFVLFTAFLTALVFYLINPEKYLNPFWQILSGALIFGSIFIATDPITSPITPLGRIFYATVIGVLTILIRNLGNFPDGFAFSVLIANALNPFFDQIRNKYQ